MLINFSVSNFLSFNQKQTFSMEAGKARKYSDRLYKQNNLKLTKCAAIFGANACGKSNLIEALKFMRTMILRDMPGGSSQKYFRQYPENQNSPSAFEVELLIENQRVVYGFSVLLKTGEIQEEYLYTFTASNFKKYVFIRNILNGETTIGDYIKSRAGKERLKMYGQDSASDSEMLFLQNMNRGKSKLYEEIPELNIIRNVFTWFIKNLTISDPNSMLTGYPYFTSTNLHELANILNALGTGISDLKIVEVPLDVIHNKMPKDILEDIVSNLEKEQTKNRDNHPSLMVRSYKEFYTFELKENGELIIKTIEFSHENKDVYFDLNEESDGTARLLDLIEILLKISDNRVFVIDEMDRCLHPALTTHIIELFLEMAKQRNTQLIITTHESRLLANDILRNDEICFVVKNKNGESILNPLEKYQLRADKKVYAALFDNTLEDVLPTYDDDRLKTILERS